MKKPPKIPNSKNWKKVLSDEYGFNYILNKNEIPSECLWSTSCSKTKKNGKKAFPSEIYRGRSNKTFYRYVEKFNLVYGVLSDKYGIHMLDEKLPYYDIHPSQLSYLDKNKLGKKVKQKLKNYSDGIIFYYPSPLLSKPYFEILWYSGLEVSYISRISLLDEL